MEISVVTTLYHSAEYIRLFHERMSQTLQGLCQNYEIILVNDGSPDHSLDVAVALQAEDPAVKVIDLSRNFGQHKAQMTGLAHTKGDLIFLIEIDLEEKPEWLTDFYQEMKQADQVDVIFGSQRSRKGRAFERWSGMLFYRLFNMLSEVKIPENHLTARLMSRRYVDVLLSYQERALFLGGVYELVGFKQKSLLVDKKSHSETTYSFLKKVRLMVDGVTSFSSFPLTFIFWTGAVVLLFSASLIIYLIFNWMGGAALEGWTSLIASIWTIGGLLMMSMGVLGAYLRKVLIEVKARPYTIVKDIY